MARMQALCAFAAAVILVAGPVSAAEDAVLRAAKKEGKVTWYTSVSLSVAQEVCKKFNAKNLGVQCVVHRDGSEKLYQRYLQEDKGNGRVADVLHTSDIGQYLTLKGQHLLPYRPKGTENFNPAFLSKDDSWTVLRAGVFIPFYNTKKVTPAEAPKSWKDFADPKWKDRLTHAHPNYSGFVVNGMVALRKILGDGYYQQLADLKPKIVQSAVAPIALVARGEADAAVGASSYEVFESIKKGEPLKVVVPTEGVALVESPNAILKKAPNPNAAKMFVDYLHGLEAQQFLADRFLYVGHPDVKYPEGLPSLKELKLHVLEPERLQMEKKGVQELFRKVFGV